MLTRHTKAKADCKVKDEVIEDLRKSNPDTDKSAQSSVRQLVRMNVPASL